MTLARWRPPKLISARSSDRRLVAWLELFYDLIYAAALIQLGQTLVDDLSLGGIARFVALFTLLWWAWIGTTFLMNRFDVDDLAHRWLMIGQMFAIGVMAVFADGVFDEYSAGFAVAYFFIRLSLVLMYARIWQHVPRARPLARSFLVFNGASTALWLISVAVPPPFRFWLWGVAFLIDVSWILSPRIHTHIARNYPIDRAHMTERFALFTIIVLGESFIKIIGSISDYGVSGSTLFHGASAFLVVVALWWTYFDDIADSPILETESDVPLTAIWTFLHLPLTIGLTATGVALSVLVLTEIDAAVPQRNGWLLIGALTLVLASVAGLDSITRSRHFGLDARRRIALRVAAILLLIPLGLIGPSLTTTAFLIAGATILIGQIAFEVAVARHADRAMVVEVEKVLRSALTDDPCAHLDELSSIEPATAGCMLCVENGMTWVHLRHCAICGRVGCCDDSPGRHAAGHFVSTGHPTMRSMEPGERWAWCYEDKIAIEA